MGLTSPVLPYLLAVVSGLLLIGILAGWPRLAGRGTRKLALRIVSLCALQACVLSLIFVTVNRAGEFYSSWSDLLGSDSGAGNVLAARADSVPNQRAVVVSGRSVVRLPGNHRAVGGTLLSITIHGQLSGLAVAGHVYLPAGYRQADATRRYPVVVVISDTPSNSGSPYAAGRIAQDAAVEMAAHRLEPLIMVMLPATLAPGDRTCLNVPPTVAGGRTAAAPVQGETFFSQDVPDVIESVYRASAQPGNWALLADDSGGYCALQLAMDNSYVFATAVVPRGNYSRPPGNLPALDTASLRQQDDLVWQLSHLPMQPVSVLLAGPGSIAAPGAAEPFLALAHPPMGVSATQLAPGSWPLGHVLDWIGAAVRPHGHTGTTG